MLYQHAVENDMDAVIFLGEWCLSGSGTCRTNTSLCFDGVDLYHSIGRVNDMVERLKFNGKSSEDRKKTFKEDCIELLRYGKVQGMLDRIEAMSCKEGKEKKLESNIGYFRTNMDCMHYGVFTTSGIFVGFGVIEAGCKAIVGNRMKQAGMHWSKDHAEKMIALWCAIRNGVFIPILDVACHQLARQPITGACHPHQLVLHESNKFNVDLPQILVCTPKKRKFTFTPFK